MSWVGLIAIIVLVAAAAIGAVVFARNRGHIKGTAALAITLIALALASVVFLYPAVLTVQEGERTGEAR